jgi:hypothetical protein
MTDNPTTIVGAIKSEHDERDVLYTDVAFGSAPFDWNKGYNAEADLVTVLGHTYTTTVKDQNGSGSCGGQAEAYGGAVISAFHDKAYEEKSAKFTYAPCAQPGGGSAGRDLADRAVKIGWGSEVMTTSYDAGKPPAEAFMQRVSDITQDAVIHASHDKALTYTLLPIDIDTIAQAIRDYKFVRLGVVGSNNNTWWTPDPKPPTDAEHRWYHWVACLRAEMRNGKKAIAFRNSWGAQVGDNGVQWLNEDWFRAHLSNDAHGHIPLFEPRCYTWNEQSLPSDFHYTFNTDLEYGMVNPENQLLQTALRLEGVFPSGIPYNDRFGTATLIAVQLFQMKYGIAKPGMSGYGRFGPLTRGKMNALHA